MVRANVRNKVGSWWGLFRTKHQKTKDEDPQKELKPNTWLNMKNNSGQAMFNITFF